MYTYVNMYVHVYLYMYNIALCVYRHSVDISCTFTCLQPTETVGKHAMTNVPLVVCVYTYVCIHCTCGVLLCFVVFV